MAELTEDQARKRLEKLCAKLDKHAPNIEKYERYYNGEQNLRFATRKFREAFGALFREFSDNWCATVVDATTERMRIEGFRFPQTSTEAEDGEENEGGGVGNEGDSVSDPTAWEIWQRNKLDLYSDIAHETALVTGRAYLLVGPQPNGDKNEPLITVEHPLEVTTESVPGMQHIRSGALKRWWDHESEYFMATLYLPGKIWKWQSDKQAEDPGGIDKVNWVLREGEGEAVIDNPFGEIVPVVPMIPRQKLHGDGRSEIADIMSMQDAINKLFNDAIVASEFAAFRQRLLTGMEVPEDENGNIIVDFDLKAAINRIMVVKDKDVGVHEFQVSDLSQYSNMIKLCRDHIAARSRTPPQYLIGEVVNVSGDALKAAESGLVNKVRRRSRFCGEAWEEAMRLAFYLKGDSRASAYTAETIWANPEITTESALADSLAKYATLGVPPQALWERMGASQQEIVRWMQLLKEQPVILPPAPLTGIIRAGATLAE